MVLTTGGTRHLTQLTSSLMGKENLAQDASTLVDLGLKLQQAMAHAQELRQARLASGADEGCNGVLLCCSISFYSGAARCTVAPTIASEHAP